MVNKDEEGLRFMLGVYEATLRSHMVYSGTSGVPEKVGDASTIGRAVKQSNTISNAEKSLRIMKPPAISLIFLIILDRASVRNPIADHGPVQPQQIAAKEPGQIRR